MNNIQVVDDVVHQTESLFSSFYDDSDTAFVFTRTTACRKLEIMEMEVMSFTLILFVTTDGVMKCQTPTTLVPL